MCAPFIYLVFKCLEVKMCFLCFARRFFVVALYLNVWQHKQAHAHYALLRFGKHACLCKPLCWLHFHLHRFPKTFIFPSALYSWTQCGGSNCKTVFLLGQSQLISTPQPIVAAVGDDILLPCHLEPAVDIAAKTLEWTRPDLNPRFVHVWRAGQNLVTVKNPSYKGRTSLFTDEVKKGNISLKLSKVKPPDEGRYRCYIPEMNIDSFVELVVGK